MGFWLVVATVLIGVAAAALVAAALGRQSPPHAEGQRAPRAVLVVLAASDAVGEGLASPNQDNWVALLGKQLPDGVEIHNLAVAGSTVSGALQTQLPAAVRLAPDVALCWLAVNDFLAGVPLSAYVSDLTSLLNALRQSSRHVFVGNLPDISALPALSNDHPSGAAEGGAIAAWNAAIAKIGDETGVTVVDLASTPLAPEDLGPDGFHPSAIGQSRLAGRFLPAVRRVLPCERP